MELINLIMERLIILNFLKSFFKLFKAKIEEYKIFDKNIQGFVGWVGEDDKQRFIFKDEFDVLLLAKTKYLCDYLTKFNLMDNDKITISETDLVSGLNKEGWNDNEIKDTINFLMKFDVKMIDDGEETDSFFVHF